MTRRTATFGPERRGAGALAAVLGLVVVLGAAGKAFCAGHNLKEMRARPDLTYADPEVAAYVAQLEAAERAALNAPIEPTRFGLFRM